MGMDDCRLHQGIVILMFVPDIGPARSQLLLQNKLEFPVPRDKVPQEIDGEPGPRMLD